MSPLRTIDKLWFRPAPASRLALLRVIVAIYVLQDLLRTRAAVLREAAQPADFWEPVGLAVLLDGPLPVQHYALALDACVVGVVLMALGVGWRVLGPLLAVLYVFVGSYRLSWGMIYRVGHLPTLHLFILGFAPAAAALSVDRWLARRWSFWKYLSFSPLGPDRVQPSGVYGWPIQLMGLVAGIAYFLAGVAKVNGESGWAWADGHNLLDQIGYDGIHKDLLDDEPAAAIIPWLYQHPTVLLPLATGTLFLELGAPLAILHRRLGWFFSAGLFGMHWGIRVMMNLTFPYPICGAAFACFFPIERLLPKRWRDDEAAST